MTRELEGDPDRQPAHPLGFARRALTAVCIAAGVALVLLLLWYAVDVLLLVFAGVLLAIYLRGLADWVSARTHLSGGWSLVIVLLVLLALFVAGGWLLAPRVAEQVDQLVDHFPRSMQKLEEQVGRYAWGRRIIAQIPDASALVPKGTNVLARATGIFSSTLGVLANFVIVLFVGLYLASEPRLYTGGFARLVPLARRDRVREVLKTVGTTLRWWLTGRVILMIINGVMTAVGLWLLGVPLALTLGILAALLNFIPNIGPIIAGVPAVGIALVQSPTQALYVLLLYVGLQMIDGYILTPLVDRRTVSLPPALTITMQVFMGVLFGALGLALASPLTAAAMVLVRMLYVEDVLGDRSVDRKIGRAPIKARGEVGASVS